MITWINTDRQQTIYLQSKLRRSKFNGRENLIQTNRQSDKQWKMAQLNWKWGNWCITYSNTYRPYFLLGIMERMCIFPFQTRYEITCKRVSDDYIQLSVVYHDVVVWLVHNLSTDTKSISTKLAKTVESTCIKQTNIIFLYYRLHEY